MKSIINYNNLLSHAMVIPDAGYDTYNYRVPVQYDNTTYTIIITLRGNKRYGDVTMKVLNSTEQEMDNVTLRAYWHVDKDVYSCWLDGLYRENDATDHMGLGTAMMQCLLYMLHKYDIATDNTCVSIVGSIGEGSAGDPAKSVPFYTKFDNHPYPDDIRTLHMDRPVNCDDRCLFYTIK